MDIEEKPEEEIIKMLTPQEDKEQPMETSEALPVDKKLNEEISENLNESKTSEKNESIHSDDKEPEKKDGPRQRKKRKKSKKIVRSKDYPKYYQNAYVRFCNEIRPAVCLERPELDPVEVTKLVASMWYNLAKEEKQPYLDLARIDKERFNQELKEFEILNPIASDEGSLNKSSKKKPRKKKLTTSSLPSSPVMQSPNHNIAGTSSSFHAPQPSLPQVVKREDDVPRAFIGTNCEVPIFTDVFLDHNKSIEAELKILRKNNIEMEQQNSVLMKHIENMENGVFKVENEVALTKKKNMQLEVYLTKLRCLLAANFHSLSLPGSKGGATVENIDKYLLDLSQKSHTGTSTKAREILKNVDFKIFST